MAILKIARMGHPVLRRPALPVADPTAPEIARLIEDMTETLEDAEGAGLAAPPGARAAATRPLSGTPRPRRIGGGNRR